jgi:PPM family protein phosphatase
LQTSIFISYSFSEIGKRTNNEDSIYPIQSQANTSTRLFLVCDGMGGTEGGETASRMTCEIISQYFSENVKVDNDTFLIEQHINNAVEQVQKQFDAVVLEKPHLNKMGTTLSLLYIHSQGVTIAHIGDSRVYHIQDDNFWHTEDHSLVYELYKIGAIEKPEMVTHPNKNIITKVIQSNAEKIKPDIKHLSNLKSEDYFLLMSDGVLEAFTEDELLSLIRDKTLSDSEKLDRIKKTCNELSSDNHSLIIIKIQESSMPKQSKKEGWLKMLSDFFSSLFISF